MAYKLRYKGGVVMLWLRFFLFLVSIAGICFWAVLVRKLLSGETLRASFGWFRHSIWDLNNNRRAITLIVILITLFLIATFQPFTKPILTQAIEVVTDYTDVVGVKNRWEDIRSGKRQMGSETIQETLERERKETARARTKETRGVEGSWWFYLAWLWEPSWGWYVFWWAVFGAAAPVILIYAIASMREEVHAALTQIYELWAARPPRPQAQAQPQAGTQTVRTIDWVSRTLDTIGIILEVVFHLNPRHR